MKFQKSVGLSQIYFGQIVWMWFVNYASSYLPDFHKQLFDLILAHLRFGRYKIIKVCSSTVFICRSAQLNKIWLLSAKTAMWSSLLFLTGWDFAQDSVNHVTPFLILTLCYLDIMNYDVRIMTWLGGQVFADKIILWTTLYSGHFVYQKSTIGTTITAIEANNDTYCLQKRIEKFPLIYYCKTTYLITTLQGTFIFHKNARFHCLCVFLFIRCDRQLPGDIRAGRGQEGPQCDVCLPGEPGRRWPGVPARVYTLRHRFENDGVLAWRGNPCVNCRALQRCCQHRPVSWIWRQSALKGRQTFVGIVRLWNSDNWGFLSKTWLICLILPKSAYFTQNTAKNKK